MLGAAFIALVPPLLYVFWLTSIGVLHRSDLRHLPAQVALAGEFMTFVPLFVYLITVVPPLARRSMRSLGVRMPTPSEIGIAVLGSVAMWLVVDPTSVALSAVTHAKSSEAAIELLKSIRGPFETAEFVVLAVVVAPLVEEFAFRVFLFGALARHFGFWGGAIGSSLCFGFVHAGSAIDLVIFSIPLALGGFVLAYVYARTGCYFANVITHALFNALPVIAVFVFHAKPS